MYTVLEFTDHNGDYTETFYDLSSAKKALQALALPRGGYALIVDQDFRELYGKYITACGQEQIRDRTI